MAMSKVLLIYGTTDGHTAKVAARITHTLEGQGCSVDLIDARGISSAHLPEQYDAVIVAASVHIGNYQSAVKRWVHHHAASLNGMKTAFVSVCLGVLETQPSAKIELDKILGDCSA